MRKLSCTLVASLIGAGLLVAAPSASAEMPSGMEIADRGDFPGTWGMACANHYMEGHRTAKVCWDFEDENFWVKDDERDGYSAVASWSIPAEVPALSASGYCRNKSGNGTWRYCHVRNSDNGVIVFGAGVYDGNARDKWPARFQDWTRETL
jgi:hypothetical protein